MKSPYIPAKYCFDVLEAQSARLKLNRPQILAILAWSDCYDERGVLVDYRRFAIYAGDMIERMLGAEMQENRALAISQGQINTHKALNGMSESELIHYFELAFKHEPGLMPIDQFAKIVHDTPGLKLSKKEALAVTAVLTHTNDNMVNWREFMPLAFQTLVAVCRER